MLEGPFSIPTDRVRRALILSDVANEADDDFFIAHALLTRSLEVRGIVATRFSLDDSVSRSFEEARQLLRVMGMQDCVPIVRGSETSLDDEKSPNAPDCLQLLEGELSREDERPLYLLCTGGLTEVALILRRHPEAIKKLVVIWVGGGRYPAGGHEANLARDVTAAREVLASGVQLWQVPSGAYKRLSVSLAELRLRLSDCGALGEYLWSQLNNFASKSIDRAPWIHPEKWVLGDQAALAALLDDDRGQYRLQPAPRIGSELQYVLDPHGPSIRVYERVNERLVLEDMWAKYRLFACEEAAGSGRRF